MRKAWIKGIKLGRSNPERKKEESKAVTKLRLRGKEKIAFYIVGVFLVLGLTWLFFESLIFGIMLMPIVVFIEPKIAEEVQKQKEHNWENELQKYLTELDSNIRLGHSLEQSTIEAVRKSNFMEEESWMIQELEMNVFVTDVFRKLAKKRQMESLLHFTSALESAMQSGSNLHELIQNSIFQIQKKLKMETEIRSMLTKVKYESMILVGFVPFLMLYLKSFSYSFAEVMYHSLTGRLIMLVCLAIYLVAVFLCYYMSQVEV